MLQLVFHVVPNVAELPSGFMHPLGSSTFFGGTIRKIINQSCKDISLNNIITIIPIVHKVYYTLQI